MQVVISVHVGWGGREWRDQFLTREESKYKTKRLYTVQYTVQILLPAVQVELLEKRTADILFNLHWWNINIIVATFLWHSASEYAKKKFSKNDFHTLCTGHYVSPPIDQYLKFKNHCSLIHRVPTPTLPSSTRGKAGGNHLNEEITPLLPTWIGEWYSKTK